MKCNRPRARLARLLTCSRGGFAEGAAERLAKRGSLEHYRLSRQEYAHTIYDLLGVVYDVEAPGTFNEDPRIHGFDRIGALLSVAPSHIERYLEAAEAVVTQALPESEIPTKTDRRIAGEGKRRLLQLGEGWGFDLKHPGRYRLRIRGSGLAAFTGRIPRMSIWHRHHKRSFDGVDLVHVGKETNNHRTGRIVPRRWIRHSKSRPDTETCQRRLQAVPKPADRRHQLRSNPQNQAPIPMDQGGG